MCFAQVILHHRESHMKFNLVQMHEQFHLRSKASNRQTGAKAFWCFVYHTDFAEDKMRINIKIAVKVIVVLTTCIWLSIESDFRGNTNISLWTKMILCSFLIRLAQSKIALLSYPHNFIAKAKIQSAIDILWYSMVILMICPRQ